jgi:Flp pilus assembly protein TadG
MRPTHTSDRRGVVALEFAIAALPLFLLVVGILEMSYDLFTQAVLNYAVNEAARTVQVGSTHGTSGETSATFAASAVCPALSGLLDCGQLIVGVAPVPAGYNYFTTPAIITVTKSASATGNICTGQAGQLMLLQAWYIGPSFVGALIPAFTSLYNGALVHITTATAGFLNEDFSGGQTQGSAC